MNFNAGTRVAILFGRILLTLSLIALIGAWITQVTGTPLFGMSQQHLFNDAIALALLGIGMFLDALWHARVVTPELKTKSQVADASGQKKRR